MWKKEEYGDGSCINCGYLGKKDMEGFGEIWTASAEDRTTGQLVRHLTFMGSHKTVPWCFVGKFNLKDEVDQLDNPQINEATRIFSVLRKDRQCPSWYHWREFSSPKEQWDESVILAMEKRRQDFEIQMEKDRKEFDLKLFEMSQRIQKDSKAIVEKSDRFNRKITVLIIILAVLEVAGTLLALFFPNGFCG
ncbi:hypothetical protein ACFLUU_07230 [Chloroflexota bacterium]